ncbi:MAG: DUF2891 domain-containing protein [Betaproteobacteria bacterium]
MTPSTAPHPAPHFALTSESAAGYARLALANLAREYPAKLDHFINGADDLRAPSLLHPLFHGSFDWHSCVHAHWMLARLLRAFPESDTAGSIRTLFDSRFTEGNVAGELAYLGAENRGSFVRTYGWAWLLKLSEELARGSEGSGFDGDAFRHWRGTLEPLAQAFVRLYLDYLPRARVPLRYGMHPNSAFGLAFAIDYADSLGNAPLLQLCREKALDWFAADTDYPARVEPSGSDFLSPALVEADLMRRVLDAPSFSIWLQRFLPQLAQRQPAALFNPAQAGDPSDPQMVHLDGLNLSRAWCCNGIAGALPEADPRSASLRESARVHLAAGLPAVHSGDYMGEHWLATFAVFALSAD